MALIWGQQQPGWYGIAEGSNLVFVLAWSWALYPGRDVLLSVTGSWLKEIDDGKVVKAVFLDLAKAFNCVNYESYDVC